MKTKMIDHAEAEEEIKRINGIKDRRKLFADTQVVTTHFLKKCVAVPVYDEDDLEEATSPDKVATKGDKMRMPTAEEYEEIKEMHQRSVFKRGGMNFEDYNYRSFNKFILVNRDVPGAAETSEEEVASDVVSKKYYQPG